MKQNYSENVETLNDIIKTIIFDQSTNGNVVLPTQMTLFSLTNTRGLVVRDRVLCLARIALIRSASGRDRAFIAVRDGAAS